MIRDMTAADARDVLAIYAYGLSTRNATFETRTPSWGEWDSGHHAFCRLVCQRDERVVGWVALSPVSQRACYRGVAEISIYVAEGFSGQGIGSRMLRAAIEASEQRGIWTLFASVFPENAATVHLHLRNGFRRLGVRERIAQLDGVWRDTVILERRSARVGIDSQSS
jgi:phosphinothricin acetyltransferase